MSETNQNLVNQIHAVLFAGARPFSVKKLAEFCGVMVADVEAALHDLDARLDGGSTVLQKVGNDLQLVTKSEYSELVRKVVRDELHGELTRPQLETLTILAYRGPLTRPELEQIRGVASALILRNLLLRGLIEEKEDRRLGQLTYMVTFEFLQHLGLKSFEQLPEYAALRTHENVMDVLQDLEERSGEQGSKE